MKKKFIIAALLAGVMAASCFTGCIGNGSEENGEQGQEQGPVEKGVEVTAEEWASAINASMNSQNFSYVVLHSETTMVTGKYKGNDKIPVNLVSGSTYDPYNYVDSGNDNFEYYNLQGKDWVSGFADIYSHEEDFTEDWLNSLKDFLSSYGIYDIEDKEESAVENTYYVKIGDKYYSADKYADKDKESEWSVSETDFSGITLAYALIQFATEEKGEEKPLIELYEAFTYSDGVYTADLWSNGKMGTVSISFKDGYILSVEYKHTESKAEEKDGLTVTRIYESTTKIYDIGKTSITPAPEAVEAIEDYIKEHS